jgi:hypothetical protein
MSKKRPSRIERVSEVIKSLHGKMTDGVLWRALGEAGCLDGVEVHSEAEARRYLRGLLRQHNRRCERIGDIDSVIFKITEVKGKTTKVTEA